MLYERVIEPFRRRFRTARMRLFVRLFNVGGETKVIDVGGLEYNWRLIDAAPQVTIVNLYGEEQSKGTLVFRRGDGRALSFADKAFDIAYSNSVIEHVGEAADQRAFAGEIARVAPRYFVQTPNRWFFLDPHFMTPFVHLLPRWLLRRMLRNFTVVGWLLRPGPELTSILVDQTNLLTVRQMRALFPDAEIHRERFLGMTKSIIAIKR